MSTRSVVARKTEDSWKGVYCHWDGYPTARGPEIFRILREQFFRDPESSKWGNAQADPKTAVRAFCDIYIDGHLGGWSSFGDECYCHSPHFVMRDGAEEKTFATPESSDPLFIEWVYVIDPETQTMEVLCNYDKLAKNDGSWQPGQPYEYSWKNVATVDLNRDEPDWKEIEER